VDNFLQTIGAINDETRVKILNFINIHGEVCVCDIENSFSMIQTRVSRHLKILKDAGFLKNTYTPPVGDNGGPDKSIIPIEATKPIDPLLIKPKDNFFNFVAYKVGGLSGGVSYGPAPKRGPNPQVPPIKMKKGGYKK